MKENLLVTNSTVDYLLAKGSDFDKLLDFEIGDINEFFYHAFLDIKIKIFMVNKTEKLITKQMKLTILTFPSDDVLDKLRANYKFKCRYQQEETQKIVDYLNREETKKILNDLNSCLNDITVADTVFTSEKNFDQNFQRKF